MPTKILQMEEGRQENPSSLQEEDPKVHPLSQVALDQQDSESTELPMDHFMSIFLGPQNHSGPSWVVFQKLELEK